MSGRQESELKEDDTCRDCVHLAADKNFRRFQCRRFPPVRYKDITGNIKTGWPSVRVEDWCGEFQRKAVKIIRRFRSDKK